MDLKFGRKPMMGPEQKSNQLITDLGCRFSSPGKQIMPPLPSKLSTAKWCQMVRSTTVSLDVIVMFLVAEGRA